MTTDFDLIVVGAGSGGLTAAIGGAGIGAKVLLIEKDKLGGDCTHYGCVPSKTLIKAGRVARQLKNAKKYGLSLDIESIDFGLENVLKKVQNTISFIEKKYESKEHIESFGVKVVLGGAKFVSENEVVVGDAKYSARKIVIATGGRARMTNIPGSESVNLLTNKEIFIPQKMKSITIIGAGPIGSELSQALNNLGVHVNLVQRDKRILNIEDGEAADLVQKRFEEEGIKIFTNQNFVEVKQNGEKKIVVIEDLDSKEKREIESDEILLSIGRVPNIEGMDLEKAGVEYDQRGIMINSKTQTSNKNIYAIGDVARGMQFTHFANHQGKVALTNAIFHLPTNYETEVIPRVTFTDPEIASIGINEDQVKKENLDYIVLKKDYSDIDRAITESEEDGFFKIIVDQKGFVKGAVLVGEGSGELIGEIAVAMKNKIKISKLAGTIHPYPTFGYGLRTCADQFRSRGYTESKKRFIKKIFKLRG